MPNSEDTRAIATAIASEVRDIMSMYASLQTFVEKNRDSAFSKEDVIFPGFDLNNEPAHYGCADDMVNRDGEFPTLWVLPDDETGGRYMNSHSPRLAIYRKMLKVWRRTSRDDLSAEQMFDILLEAQYHSAHRQEPGQA
jgi:uncharacterized protein YfbU (UPF0304 family)